MDSSLAQQILEFINETPHYYNTLGSGLTFKERIGVLEITVQRNREAGGINVACNGEILRLYWDPYVYKWGVKKPTMVRG